MRWAILAAFVGLFAFSNPPAAGESGEAAWPGGPPRSPTKEWATHFGGRLYDKWWRVLDVNPPSRTHRAYPAAGRAKGASTWRCKECHGWDYKGVQGAYRTGRHATGIAGIRGAVGADPGKIAVRLRSAPHDYTRAMIPDAALERLAWFVSAGQIDMDKYIDRRSGKARGDARRGKKFYQNICAACHGFDGKAVNFGDDDDPEFVGTVAQENPWEALHKIRNGQPGAPMPALGVLKIRDVVDILAYTQSLPLR